MSKKGMDRSPSDLPTCFTELASKEMMQCSFFSGDVNAVIVVSSDLMVLPFENVFSIQSIHY
jgi:hypothetical protein